MTDQTVRQNLWWFAALLEYPQANLAVVATRCAALLARDVPDAAPFIQQFYEVVARTPAGRLEEIYTGTFDLDPVCYPYIGYHVFGETYKRSVFLLALKERYRANGLEVEGELTDHIAVVLRYLAVSEDAEDVAVIVREGMLPALQRMTGRAKSAGHEDETPAPAVDPVEADARPYRGVLEALRLFLLETADLDEDDLPELAEPAQRSMAH